MSAVVIKLIGLAVVLGFATLVWAASVRMKDASVVDRVWGLLFVIYGGVYAALGDGYLPRRVLILVLVTIWGLRLSGFITWRNRGHAEDKRYQAMRAKDPQGFPRRSLVTVFWLQTGLAFLISGPLFYPMIRDDTGLGWLDAVGVAVWLVGFVFEAGGDWQLSRFLADPANSGVVMDRGLWRYTRHPNYFGDTTVWAGFAIICIASGAWWGVYGAVIMGVMIVRVSGVALTDKVMAGESKREGYDEYLRRTNAFIPGPRKPA